MRLFEFELALELGNDAIGQLGLLRVVVVATGESEEVAELARLVRSCRGGGGGGGGDLMKRMEHSVALLLLLLLLLSVGGVVALALDEKLEVSVARGSVGRVWLLTAALALDERTANDDRCWRRRRMTRRMGRRRRCS